MKALVVQPSTQPGGPAQPASGAIRSSLLYADVPLPPLAPGECRVAVRLAGICRTDIELCQGYAGFRGTPGHEFVGTVIEGHPALMGRRVVGEINVGCGQCPACLSGLCRHCPERTVLGIRGRSGAFAESLTLPAENLLPVPAELADELAVFCEPLSAALAIFEQLPSHSGTRVLVLGDGKLGLLVSQVCVQRGLLTTLRGRHPRKLALAESWGVQTELSSIGESSVSAGERYPLVIECTGTPQALAQALRQTAPRGVLVLKSTYAATAAAAVDWSALVVDEIHVVGSRCGRFAPALELLQSGAIDVESLIDDCLPLSQGVAAFAQAGTRGTLKVLLRPD
jgi:threonine dehydrogenase-like Zn-dependent dehydrogenase